MRVSRPISWSRPSFAGWRPVAVPDDGMRARRAQALCDGIALPGARYDELHALAEG
ncbi:hypothetical protein [Pseudooceanicola sp.]|jgi:LDH2 family malate/lactate/ureidoglycolate dehydrogenase|uniref:hypothetical protein n=1 Tax=Pseudooceanicola sp. TaxID=1914328 RepID=UPI0035154C64